ncbi:FecR family protein [Flavivirga spongiicola]|uniref:FecR domain-containing protein n=1 Tax=Flavivirga spongiicola TaxID=421621 RepID=A0ABU7XTR8_9FLAO|nr:FecR family protein [Flavivirga sp. MEBiC05379]MDO5979178.1 FecR domain-containing protein [Flavivirga sp. MEBiC05379]
MKTLILKFLTNCITPLEEEKLCKWLKETKNKNTFKTYVHDIYALNMHYSNSIDDIDADILFNNILSNIQKPNNPIKPVTPLWIKYAVAASITILISLAFIFNNDNSQVVEPIIVNNTIKTGTDKATLTLESGEEVALTKGTSIQTPHANSNGEAIIYKNTSSQQLVYNYLTVPRGGQFQLTLSDGTQVWLNSESQLKYPVSFTDGNSRQVELVYGEAYFDVSPSTEHQGSNFKVYHKAQEIQVLGTEFNVKAYKDETHVYTTLAEGKVSVSTENENNVLEPNEQSNLNTTNKNLTVSKVNVYSETSWKDGIFSFIDKPLKDVTKVLERWYDVDVIFMNQSLGIVEFNGVLGKDQSIEEILGAIKSISINNYEINNKTIIIK